MVMSYLGAVGVLPNTDYVCCICLAERQGHRFARIAHQFCWDATLAP